MTLNDALYEFRLGRGTGTDTLEAKLVQQLVGIAHEPLFQVFLDVRKVYKSMDRVRCTEIMRGYGMVQNMARLIAHHYSNQHFVPKTSRFPGMAFGIGRRVTQGNPTSPVIFNIMADVVVRAVLLVVCGTQEVQHGMGWATGERKLVFYADVRRISGRGNIWV